MKDTSAKAMDVTRWAVHAELAVAATDAIRLAAAAHDHAVVVIAAAARGVLA